MYLSDLKPGDICTVTRINAANEAAGRFENIGLIKGTKIKCMQRSPLGDPVAYLIRGAVIALRLEDSVLVQIQQGG